jgi:hypothetical protein
MSTPTFLNIFLSNNGDKISYSPITKPITVTRPNRNRERHGAFLRRKFSEIQSESEAEQKSRSALSLPTKDGIYLHISSQANMGMDTKGFDLRSHGIRMLQQYEVENEDGTTVNTVILYLPTGQVAVFLQKITEYLEKETGKGVPRNSKLLIGIEDIKLATLEAFWKGDREILNNPDNELWCELWLRTLPQNKEEVVKEFKESCALISIEIRENQQLNFPERVVVLGKTSIAQLAELLEITPHLAEIRPANIPVSFLIDETPVVQAEFAEELANRIVWNNENDIGILILDSGVNNGHILLQNALLNADLHTYDPSWNVNDQKGHGTGMSGLALLGDLHPLLSNLNSVEVNHCLESGKILPNNGQNPYHLYGSIITQVVSRAEIQAPNRKRIYCMAVTSDEFKTRGAPTSWSAAIDVLCSGADDDIQRLFFISTGNIADEKEWLSYPDNNLLHSIEDPAQAWNAITVGAYTEKTFIDKKKLPNFEPIAETGNLSPFSMTSASWNYKKWPVKPDIVMEGGNAAIVDDDFGEYASICNDLSPLSIWYKPTQRQYEPFGMTSGATALAARMAAQIQNSYPDIAPETVRGLMIHSAEWTPAMLNSFLKNTNKEGYRNLVRTCGFGVPNLYRATTCLKNRLNLVIESEIQPFYKKVGGSYGNKEMEIFDLPWPKAELLQMRETEVELRITLSYFIEPGPGEIGWKDRYRYASHGLRFDLNRVGEDREKFLARVNKKSRDEYTNFNNDIPDGNWLLGINNRQLGSIHSDIWRGTAAEMATSNLIGIYPVIGWWKERAYLKKYDKKTRYSLIVSLKTTATEIDI